MGAELASLIGGRSKILHAATGRAEAPPRFAALAGILFDLEDVLYDATLWRRWLRQLLARLGLAASYGPLFRIWERDFLDAVRRGQRDYAEAFEAFLLSLGLSRGQIDEVTAAGLARRQHLAGDRRPWPGVHTTLARLKSAGLALGVLCDSEYPAARLREQLDRLGIGSFLPIVVSSFDLERTFPDSACYQAAQRALDLPTQSIAFVSHDTDVLHGARAAGLLTVAFNFQRGAKADAHLHRFNELLDLVPRVRCSGEGEAGSQQN